MGSKERGGNGEKKIQVATGKFPTYWREAIWDKIWPGHGYVPKKQKPHVFAAHVFADVFVGYVPKVPIGRMVEWVNIILISLGRPSVSKSSLNAYISISKKQQPKIIPMSITE